MKGYDIEKEILKINKYYFEHNECPDFEVEELKNYGDKHGK